MKISSKEITVAQATRAGVALGHYLGLEDAQRNIRSATLEEVQEFCFGPLRKITLDYERELAIAAANITVAAFDEPA